MPLLLPLLLMLLLLLLLWLRWGITLSVPSVAPLPKRWRRTKPAPPPHPHPHPQQRPPVPTTPASFFVSSSQSPDSKRLPFAVSPPRSTRGTGVKSTREQTTSGCGEGTCTPTTRSPGSSWTGWGGAGASAPGGRGQLRPRVAPETSRPRGEHEYPPATIPCCCDFLNLLPHWLGVGGGQDKRDLMGVFLFLAIDS